MPTQLTTPPDLLEQDTVPDRTATTASTPRSDGSATVSPPRRRPAGPVIVACDGSPFVDPLFNAARVAAGSLDARIDVLGICEPTPLAPAVGGGVIAAPELDAMRQRAMLEDVRRSVSIASSGNPEWPVDVLLGAPPEALALEAERRGASLLVMGIGRHNPLDRLLGTETTLATLRRARVPVLAVGTAFTPFPRHAAVGMDFSPASLRAAKLAVRLVGDAGRVTLVHVRPRFDHPSADWRAWDQEYGRTLSPLFADAIQQLDAPADVTVETMTVRGDPAPALLAFAQQSGADLLAIGTQRHGVLDRLLVGSVATRVIRNTRIATLAAPAPLVAGPAGLAPEGARVESSEDPNAWPSMLDAFARLNLGRTALLETGPEATALRPIADHLTFTGSTTEGAGHSIRLLLERRDNGTSGHLAHVDDAVERVAIVRDAAGTDLGLRLRHARGVTRLSFR
ncbi:MAG: universal stress protein [Gemmatimonadaceae bacterium]|jgi:nucleotide-binding universal stress UspA family protein|nr:universal stress protein [Gemmatimonadaceae bacterium]